MYGRLRQIGLGVRRIWHKTIRKTLAVHEVTARRWWDYGSLPSRLRLVPLDLTARQTFPSWEQNIPALGIIVWQLVSLDHSMVISFKVSQAVANLLRHTVVVLSVASLDESGRAERAFLRPFSSEQVRARQTRQIVCCQCSCCHNSLRL